MTANDMQRAIGQQVNYESHGLMFRCTVKDVKVGWGKPRFLIAPVSGSGETWVEFSTITPIKLPQTNHLTGQPSHAMMVSR